MEDKIYLIVRLRIRTTHKRIVDAINDIERHTKLSVPSTERVTVLDTEVLRTHRK
jgi:hypothetical protein